jgi:alkylation response protein AidB-like acyl-CoA dehydrogenase
VEELAKVDAAVALIPSCQELGSLPIILAGNHEQKEKYLKPLSTGEKVAAFGLTEARGGSDVAALRTRAVRKGDKYILNGTKMFITNGVADTVTVYAVTDECGAYKGAAFIRKGTPGPPWEKESKLESVSVTSD